MPISCSRSERGSVSSSLWVSLYEGTIGVCGMMVKENDGGRWSFDGMVL
jgi:hypothetical protein